MKNKILIFFTLIIMFSQSLIAANISFQGGYTKLSMKEGQESISLENNAEVTIDDLQLSSQKIELIGKEYDEIICSGNVKFIDNKNKLKILSNNLSYDRKNEVIEINGWVEIEDTKNNIQLSASYLHFDINNESMELQTEVTLFHLSEDSLMKCLSDSLKFDRENNFLVLFGNASVDFNEDKYKAQAITIDLTTNDISMEGSIEGTIKNT